VVDPQIYVNMQISQFTIKLIIILIPGAIAGIIYEKITIHKKRNSFEFLVMAILFGGVSYLTAQTFFSIFGIKSIDLSLFWENIYSNYIPYKAVIFASISSILVALIGAYIDQFKLINRFTRWIGASHKYGDEELYMYFLNHEDIQAIYLRDKTKGLTYHGDVIAFDETDGYKELVLSNVHVYGYDDSQWYYDIDKLYVARSKDDITIEVPIIKSKDGDENG